MRLEFELGVLNNVWFDMQFGSKQRVPFDSNNFPPIFSLIIFICVFVFLLARPGITADFANKGFFLFIEYIGMGKHRSYVVKGSDNESVTDSKNEALSSSQWGDEETESEDSSSSEPSVNGESSSEDDRPLRQDIPCYMVMLLNMVTQLCNS